MIKVLSRRALDIGNEIAGVRENRLGTEPNVQTAYSVEDFAWDHDVNLIGGQAYRLGSAA
ncbi:hypothetical protein MycrhN_3561 [Mycolicibacterium rhodesiae NBB3]|uniref:Uncharacterized protein n=1 Tax=Mycolicibacterium rhodesiae (strain NBB3) TaxID=710685 RepID=G8RT93_MYCRN|nr:hypothetical protein [Mycolicibacterium rhodesiae]AEV74080.1 hypothetical protein MycrhN_3561 [Mycolicibacterium rhodesiae NBB3]